MPPLTANDIWRDFESGSSGPPHKPVKADIRVWGTALEAIGGFNAPGPDVTAALFSGGAGVAPVWRKVVGFDLPNPSLTVPGAVLAKPGAAGQIVSGIREDGGIDLHATTGTGPLVLQNNPNFTGGVSLGGVQFFGVLSGMHVVYAPDGRAALQLGGAGAQNFYKAAAGHYFYNFDGTDLFGILDAKGLTLEPLALSGAAVDPMLAITQTWNTSGAVNGIDIRIIRTAANAASRALRIRSGPLGDVELFGILSDPANATLILRGLAVLASPTGLATILYSTPLGVSFNNSAGTKFLTLISDAGVWSFYGATTGTHTLAAAANASGASTFPNTTGELINTGEGVPSFQVVRTIDFNAAGVDVQLPINPPTGYTRFRVSGFVMNTGPGAASLTTAQIAVYTAPSAGGTAVFQPQPLTGITANTPGVPGVYANLTINVAVGSLHYFNVASVPALYARITTPQGAAALGQVGISIAFFP